MNTLTVKVTAKVQEAEDIVSFELASANGVPLPPFSAGAHIDVEVRPGLVRQYSLCNDPTESHRYLIGVLRDPLSRGGSAGMHDDISVGDVINISTPRNHFPLVHGRRTLLFAGGIGITPLLCMAERLEKTSAAFEMHYCTRSPARTAFYERIRASGFADKVQFHFDSGSDDQKLKLPDLMDNPEPDTHLYVCGPTGFINHVVNTAKSLGWGADQVHLEYFGAAPADTTRDMQFEVRLASSGKSYTIPADRTVVQALSEQGIDIPVSCEQGVCGTCITRVLEGTPDHRDMYFTDEEHEKNDQFTPCCSRARSGTLVLDL